MVSKEALAPEARFEILTVNEDLYLKTRKALAKEGYTFVVAINPVSIAQLAAGEGTGSLFEYINPSEKMRSNVPPQIEIAIDPNHVRIEASKHLSSNDHYKMIKEWEAALKRKLPKKVRDLISMSMPKYASILAQLDFEYQRRTGKKFFTNWFGLTYEPASGNVVGVGRGDPGSGLSVHGWIHGRGGIDGALVVPVVVLPRVRPPQKIVA